jgi:hypothetical protein
MQTLGLPSVAREPSARVRQDRLTAARLRGTHSKAEWNILHDIFGKCVACSIPYSLLDGGRATKDHIEPLSMNGCDCVGNIQPLCRQCNSIGTALLDFRENALPGWQTIFLHRMGAYY